MAKKLKNEVTAVLEASGDTICLPDRDARVAELEDWFEAEQEFLL